MRVFGPTRWGNFSERLTVPAPIGQPCFFCEEPIFEGDLGVVMPHMDADMKDSERPWHRDCLIHSMFASDADKMATRRESARATRERIDRDGCS